MNNLYEKARPFLNLILLLFLLLQGFTLLLELPNGLANQLPRFLAFMPPLDVLSDGVVGGWIVSVVHLGAAVIAALCVLIISSFPKQSLSRWTEIAAFFFLTLYSWIILQNIVVGYDISGLPQFWQTFIASRLAFLVAAIVGAAAYFFAPRQAVIGRIAAAGRLFTIALAVLVILPIARGVRIVDYHSLRPAPVAQVPAPKNAPNIMLLIVDTLSAPAMSLYGNPLPTTPNMQRLASNATVFNGFTASSNFTISTVATIYSGMEPSWHRVVATGSYFRPRKGLEEKYLLPQVLHDAGYYTMVVAANPFGHPLKYRIEDAFDELKTPPSLCGDEDYFGFRFSKSDLFFTMDLYPIFRKLQLKWNDFFCGHVATLRFPSSAAYKIAIGRLEKRPQKNRPFFIVIHTLPPHAAYLPPPPFLHFFEKSNAFTSEDDYHAQSAIFSHDIGDDDYVSSSTALKLRYYENIRYADFALAQFLQASAKAGLLKNTIVIVTADHGESFRNWIGHGGPLLSQDLISIPLMILGPDIPKNRRVSQRLSQVDLAPTILNLAHLPIPSQMTGISLLPFIESANRVSPPVYSSGEQTDPVGAIFKSGTYSLIEGNMKYVQYLGEHEERLFDLKADPKEMRDLSKAEPQITRQFRQTLDRHFSSQKVAFNQAASH